MDARIDADLEPNHVLVQLTFRPFRPKDTKWNAESEFHMIRPLVLSTIRQFFENLLLLKEYI